MSYYYLFFFLMIRRPPRSTRTDTLFPYTTLFRSAGCSVAPYSTRDGTAPSVTPFSARLFDSVPPEVQMISRGWQFTSTASCSRSRSTASRAARPTRCSEEALPYGPDSYGKITSRQRGSRRGVRTEESREGKAHSIEGG